MGTPSRHRYTHIETKTKKPDKQIPNIFGIWILYNYGILRLEGWNKKSFVEPTIIGKRETICKILDEQFIVVFGVSVKLTLTFFGYLVKSFLTTKIL